MLRLPEFILPPPHPSVKERDPRLSTAAPADASGWDFEKDLENIFAQTPGEKPRAKAKGKGLQ